MGNVVSIKSNPSIKEKRIAKQEVDAFKTSAANLFGDAADRIIELLNSNDTEGAVTLTQKALLKSLIRMIPQAEENVRNSRGTRGVYALNTLVGSIRELLADIQANQDAALIASSIALNVLQPAFVGMAQYLVDANYRLKREMEPYLDVKDVKRIRTKVDSHAKDMAQYMQTTYKDISGKITARLVD